MSADLYLKDRMSYGAPRRRRIFPFIVILLVLTGLFFGVRAIVLRIGSSSEGESRPSRRERDGQTQQVDSASEEETTPAPASSEIVDMLRRAQFLANQDELVEAREILLEVLDVSENPIATDRAKKILDDINIKLLLSPRPMPGKIEYRVQSGDTIERIARRHGVNIELIQESNSIRGHIIHPGQRLRIPTGEFNIHARVGDNEMTVYYDGNYFKTYRIGTGKHDKTPRGESIITDRIKHPVWWQPDGKAIPYGSPDNLLGTHWLALDIRGYGIHGTWEPESIGHAESEGCIRMLNDEVEELYNIIPLGTPVSITD